MLNTLLIFLGAGVGGVLRYWISSATYWLVGRQFPYGTLVVNISGCFLMGVFAVFIMGRFNDSLLRSLLLIGLLGGYTTFSAFSLETFLLLENGAYLSATLNIFLSIVLCIAATWLGIWAAK